MSSCLLECLKEAGLERFYSVLQCRGYSTAFSLLHVSTAELHTVGILTDSDRQRFLQLVQIIASFHQGGELSHSWCNSKNNSPTLKTKSKVRTKHEIPTSTVSDFESSTDSSPTSEESPTTYILSPRRKNYSNSVTVGKKVNISSCVEDKKDPKLHKVSESSFVCQNATTKKGINLKENGSQDNNFNTPFKTEYCKERGLTTDHEQMSSDSLKVQKVMRTEGYNYGLPQDDYRQNRVGGLEKMRRRTSAPTLMSKKYSRELIRFSKMQDRITVCVRKRPILSHESQSQGFDVVTCNQEDGGKDGGLVVHELKHTVDMSEFVQQNVFQFDKVFAEHTSNKDIYEDTIKSMVDWIMTRNNRATCFGYGQTGAGKTHTLLGDDTETGVFFYAAHDVLLLVKEQNARTNLEKRKCSLFVSLYEIYCSRIFDLLNDHKRLQALEDSNKQVQINGLREIKVTNMETLEEVVRQGLSSRSVGVTGANQDSSRSHAIVQLSLKDGSNTEYSRISFIDLAGSERARDALCDSDKQNRLEGAEINQSLLALKECIRSLDLALAHTPFRQSKLTQVLRDSFVGNSKTCMIANISPSHASLEHTMNTLRYASRVKELYCKPVISTPRQRFRSDSARSTDQRPFTADQAFSDSRSGRSGLSPKSSNSSRSISVKNSSHADNFSTFNGQGCELSRTPPLSSHKDRTNKSISFNEMTDTSTPKSRNEIVDVTKVNFHRSNSTGTGDKERLSNINSIVSESYLTSSFANGKDGSSKDSKRPSIIETDTSSTASNLIPHGNHHKAVNNSTEYLKSCRGANKRSSNDLAEKSNNISSNGTDITGESNMYIGNFDKVACVSTLAESRNNSALPSPQKFLTFLKGKSNMKKQTSKPQILKASHSYVNTIENQDHSSNSPCSTRQSSLIAEVQLCSQPEKVLLPHPDSIVNVPSSPGLPSPKLDRSHPRRSSRVLHGSRSSSPGSGGRTTPDERNLILPMSSNPTTTTGLTSASELHARLAAAALNRESDSDNVRSTESEMPLYTSTKYKSITEVPRLFDGADMSKTSKRENLVQGAQSEVILAHQEHISEILRISIEEERLYHELRDQWGKGTCFGTYTKSLQTLLAKKTQSIDALKLQLSVYEQVRNASM